MEATNVTLRIDKGLKEQADELFGELGLTFTAAKAIR
jgi:antitoxin component of RelBE/YafQ-DinJ toxin-antitoxin module